MKSVLSLLFVLQVLVCTVGQGALTLCVRRDGSQRIEWTAHSECHAQHDDNCCDCKPSDEIGCDFCTDYLFIAPVAPLLSHGMPELMDCCSSGPMLIDLNVNCRHQMEHLSLHGPPPDFCPPHLSVPLRC